MNDEVFSKLTESNKKMRALINLVKDKDGELASLKEEMDRNAGKSWPSSCPFPRLAFIRANM